jgi:hypothetical protein
MTVMQGLKLSASSPYCGFTHLVVVVAAMMSEPGPSPLFNLNVDQCQAILAKIFGGRAKIKSNQDNAGWSGRKAAPKSRIKKTGDCSTM